MKTIRFGMIVGLSVFLLNACGPTRSATLEGGCRRIAFAMFDFHKQENPDIYSICPEGGHLTRLTNDPAADLSPAWSPDGSQLAFVSLRSEKSQVYVMDTEGGNLFQLTSDLSNDSPLWLPDGKQIAVRTTDEAGLWWWRTIDLGGNEIGRLTEPSYDFFYQMPAWSPDGSEIAYMSMEEQQERNDGSSQIHVREVDGSNDRALTRDIWANINPVWSRDGSKMAFLSERHGTYDIFALYVMDADGRNVRQLSDPVLTDRASYASSPDGDFIALGDVNIGHIYLIDVGTGEKTDLPGLPEGQAAFGPSWQP